MYVLFHLIPAAHLPYVTPRPTAIVENGSIGLIWSGTLKVAWRVDGEILSALLIFRAMRGLGLPVDGDKPRAIVTD